MLTALLLLLMTTGYVLVKILSNRKSFWRSGSRQPGCRIGYNRVEMPDRTAFLGALRRFLTAFIQSAWLRFSRLAHSARRFTQVPLLLCRQVLMTLCFGRGILHG
ncbi:hypothetical protein G8759_31260 [Spirosoma aureum]|uniref:Uncharacterized protein n=1 Tax=Spirosoma aureum TaxID=2692134 RepID=A0A6G9AX76_9BACT|nr:hypothetical protein [Spirosoma aureum]QIP16803.1 hypothetical protein G8759_31260 [Spirosoma aureum]